MKQKTWTTYAFWILLTEAVGGLSGWLTRDGTAIFNETVSQPPLSPPGWVFPIAWGILYALMGIGMARISLTPPSAQRTKARTLYWVQLAVNFLWSPIFFGLQAYGLALIWLVFLWVLVLIMVRAFRKLDPLAANLQIPYQLWLTFAAYLSFGVWILN